MAIDHDLAACASLQCLELLLIDQAYGNTRTEDQIVGHTNIEVGIRTNPFCVRGRLYSLCGVQLVSMHLASANLCAYLKRDIECGLTIRYSGSIGT